MNHLALPDLVRENIQYMRLAITLLALSFATGAGLYFGGQAFLGYAEKKMTAATQRFVAAQQQSAQATIEKEEVRLYLPAYASLVATGKAGKEKRLDWIDGLTRIREKNKLFPIDYDIAARQPYTLPAGPPTQSLSVSASRMTLRFGLLHEGDLLTVLNGLREENQGFYVLEGCTLNRTGQTPVPQLAENLQGECALNWLSFQPVGSEAPQP